MFIFCVDYWEMIEKKLYLWICNLKKLDHYEIITTYSLNFAIDGDCRNDFYAGFANSHALHNERNPLHGAAQNIRRMGRRDQHIERVRRHFLCAARQAQRCALASAHVMVRQ